MPIRFLINQCQIITFLILKYDIIENSRIELRGIVLPVQMGGLLGGGQRVCWPPLSNYWGGLAPPGPPSSYAYALDLEKKIFEEFLPYMGVAAILVTRPITICINFHSCAPTTFHIVFGFEKKQNKTTTTKKTRFQFGNQVTFGQGQEVTLTFDIHVAYFIHLV